MPTRQFLLSALLVVFSFSLLLAGLYISTVLAAIGLGLSNVDLQGGIVADMVTQIALITKVMSHGDVDEVQLKLALVSASTCALLSVVTAITGLWTVANFWHHKRNSLINYYTLLGLCFFAFVVSCATATSLFVQCHYQIPAALADVQKKIRTFHCHQNSSSNPDTPRINYAGYVFNQIQTEFHCCGVEKLTEGVTDDAILEFGSGAPKLLALNLTEAEPIVDSFWPVERWCGAAVRSNWSLERPDPFQENCRRSVMLRFKRLFAFYALTTVFMCVVVVTTLVTACDYARNIERMRDQLVDRFCLSRSMSYNYYSLSLMRKA